MRRSALINKLVLVVAFMSSVPACVEAVGDDGATLGTDGALLFGDEETIDYLPQAILPEQLDANGQVMMETLKCGLSILPAARGFTDYWYLGCEPYDAFGEIIADDGNGVYAESTPVLTAYRAVSGSVRGRVLRLRTRKK